MSTKLRPLSDTTLAKVKAFHSHNEQKEQEKKAQEKYAADMKEASKRQEYSKKADEVFGRGPTITDEDRPQSENIKTMSYQMSHEGMRAYESFTTTMADIIKLMMKIGEGFQLDFKANTGSHPLMFMAKTVGKLAAFPIAGPYAFAKWLMGGDKNVSKTVELSKDLVDRVSVNDGRLETQIPTDLTAQEQEYVKQHDNCAFGLMEDFLKSKGYQMDAHNRWGRDARRLLTQDRLNELKNDPVNGFEHFVRQAIKKELGKEVNFQHRSEPTASRP